MHTKHNIMIKRTADVCMTVLLLFLMAYQVTGEAAHEWIGISMTVLVVIHQILNRKWYAAIFKGKYNVYRIITTVINFLLLSAFFLTALCGMSMSGHAVPFLYGIINMTFAHRMHLSMSYWSFVLMGLHLGMHIPVMFQKMKLTNKFQSALMFFFLVACIGLFFFLKNGIPNYLFFRVPFVFLDYEKSFILVFLENILMLIFLHIWECKFLCYAKRFPLTGNDCYTRKNESIS